MASAASTTIVESQHQLTVLDHHTAPKILDGIDTLLFDCDGVLWRGSELIPRAAEALQLLRASGRRLFFVTNNASKSRAKYVDKFKSLGLQVEAQEIVSSSYAAAAYLQSVGFNKKVFLLGNVGVQEELDEAGIPWIGGEGFEAPFMGDTDTMKQLQVDPDIGAVVVGWDPHFSYSRLVYASVCLRELPDCLFVATNTDAADQLGGGRMMPGTGGLVAAVEVAAARKATVVGKGGSWLLPFLCRHLGVKPERAAIIGDRLDTDIALGKEGGLRTILTLTGVNTLEDASATPIQLQPDAVVSSVAEIAGLPK
eukprot:CAMPEP_0202891262 /NCGR_PEP_ID=MMETSP1392-20130828/1365_1 /ASSEMBLY_ACC=CAM_ASM_000868 /TAXON_ID=225041 /ORGANISM="Chlamydomonas chlamydogama, Strain SAG 11-48b" /LENGTH=310 /DNA_ID=CAMNT_0049574961 /DNA_START=214 /DNA_END=1146 /DNA_ORIENTATION=+